MNEVYITVEENGFSGYFCQGLDNSFYPVIIIGGTEGRIHYKYAELLSSNYVTSLAVGYFDLPHINKHLEYISLEYFLKAIEWLKRKTNQEKVIIIGYSHGAQIALLLGSYFPELFHKIVCFSPILYLLGGFPYVNRPAWKYKETPIKFVKGLFSEQEDLLLTDDLKNSIKVKKIPFRENTKEDPYILRDLFDAMLEQCSFLDDVRIKVELIECPVLLFSGKNDAIWHSSLYARNICQLIDAKDRYQEVIHIEYENVGHGIFESFTGGVFCRLGEFWCTLGGNAQENDDAEKDAWKKTINFIKN